MKDYGYRQVMQGVLARRTPSSFYVVELHYTAHPERRTAAWREEASKGMTSWGWRQEQEIDFTARGGEKVLENFDEAVHVIEPFIPEPSYPLGLSFDPGFRNPLAGCFYTLDRDGNIYQVSEIYGRGIQLLEASMLMKAESKRLGKDVDNLTWCVGDREMGSVRHGQATTLQAQYREAGINFRLGKSVTDEDGHALIRSMLENSVADHAGKPKYGPAFYVTRNCTNTIREFRNLTFTDRSGILNKPERAQDRDNHTIDALKNFLAMNPKGSGVRGPELAGFTERIWKMNLEKTKELRG